MGPRRAPGAGGTSLVGSSDSYNRMARRRLEGASTPTINFITRNLPYFVRNRYQPTGVARFRIPVGTGGISVQPSGTGLSNVVSKTGGQTVFGDLPKIDRRDKPPVTGGLSEEKVTVVQARDWFEYWDLKAKGIAVRKPRKDRTEGAPAELQTQPGGSDMDLGTLALDLLKQAGSAYIQKEFGTGTGMGMPFIGDIGIPGTDYGVEADLPFIDVVQRKDKCKRKRRRPIATPSEISQLASLKQVASPGEVKLFLAKRLRT